MEIKKCENSVLKVLNGYSKEEVVEIVDGLFKAKNGDGSASGYGSKKRGLQATLPPEKKKRLSTNTKIDASIMDSLKAHVRPFLENRPPPKLKIMSLAEALANLPKPKLNPKAPDTKPKATRKHPLSRPTLPQAKAAANHRRPINISASTSALATSKTKSKPSITQKQTNTPLPQIPLKFSLDLHEKQTASKLCEPPHASYSKQSTSGTVCAGKAGGSSVLELSPRRAARAAVWKSRFAATISKAQQYKLLGRDSPDVKHKQEEEAAQPRSVWDKEREAARLALRKVEEAADGRDNMSIFLEFQAMCDCNFQEYPKGYYPLQRFGLILKQ